MVRIYTSKKAVADKKVLYDPIRYFEDMMMSDIGTGEYILTEEDRAFIADEGSVFRIEQTTLITKYGVQSLSDISAYAKTVLVMRYLHSFGCMNIVNVSMAQSRLIETLDEAGRLGIDVFYCMPYSLLHDSDIGKFPCYINDSETLSDLHELMFIGATLHEPFGVEWCVRQETRLTFQVVNSSYDLFIEGNRVVVITENVLQKEKFFQDITTAINTGKLNITGTDAWTSDDTVLPLSNLILATEDNLPLSLMRLQDSSPPLILVYDGGNRLKHIFANTLYTTLHTIEIIAESECTERIRENQNVKLLSEMSTVPTSETTPVNFSYTLEDCVKTDEYGFSYID